MRHITNATQTLRKAEADLRDIVAKAAAGGDYADVVQITSWAKAVRDLLEEQPKTQEQAKTRRNGAKASTSKARPSKNGRTTRKKQPAGEYPRFFRRGDELIRVAWSRRAKSEYQHKTTEAVLKSIADILARVGKKGKIFSTDEVLPVLDANGAEVPDYQAYVCIALLKINALIEQHGRQGYSISSPDGFADAVDALWTKLPPLKQSENKK